VAFAVLLITGCGPPATNRFPHGLIQETSAPWDGAATELMLAENPLKDRELKVPRLSLQIYQHLSALSKQRVKLDGKESRKGIGQWIAGDGTSQPIAWAVVTFGEVRKGTPVEGTYEVKLADGSRAEGKFRAEWLPGAGRGG